MKSSTNPTTASDRRVPQRLGKEAVRIQQDGDEGGGGVAIGQKAQPYPAKRKLRLARTKISEIPVLNLNNQQNKL